MGASITTQVQIKRGSEWVDYREPIFLAYDESTSNPFSQQNYGLFGFLADVRNYACVPVLKETRGLPHVDEPDWGEGLGAAVMATEWEPWPEHLDNHSATWFLASELLEFDYDMEFENRRDETTSLNDTLPSGQGVVTTVRAYIGQYYFDELERLTSIGDPKNTRVVISFCS